MSEYKIKEFNLERSGLNDKITYKNLEYFNGIFIYLVIFGLIIPYTLIQYKQYAILEGYIPNLDLIGCVLGYSGGPYGLFKYLYNPAANTIAEMTNQIIINYTALLSVTYIISYYTLKTKSISKGWSRAFIMLLFTYLVPGYFIAYFLYIVGDKINYYYEIGTFINWLITVIFGFVFIVLIIFIEIITIRNVSPYIEQFINYIQANIK